MCRAWKTDIKGATEGKLKGMSVVVKDSIPVAGVPLRNGSRVLDGYTPDFDATVVSRILSAGLLCDMRVAVLAFPKNGL